MARPQWDLVADAPAIWPRRLAISGQMGMGQNRIPYKLDGKGTKIKHLTSQSDVLWFENQRLYVYTHIMIPIGFKEWKLPLIPSWRLQKDLTWAAGFEHLRHCSVFWYGIVLEACRILGARLTNLGHWWVTSYNSWGDPPSGHLAVRSLMLCSIKVILHVLSGGVMFFGCVVLTFTVYVSNIWILFCIMYKILGCTLSVTLMYACLPWNQFQPWRKCCSSTEIMFIRCTLHGVVLIHSLRSWKKSWALLILAPATGLSTLRKDFNTHHSPLWIPPHFRALGGIQFPYWVAILCSVDIVLWNLFTCALLNLAVRYFVPLKVLYKCFLVRIYTFLSSCPLCFNLSPFLDKYMKENWNNLLGALCHTMIYMKSICSLFIVHNS